MKVLITGGKGMVGSFFKDAFMEVGDTVYAPGREEMDITDREKVLETIRMIKPDVLIHCAAYTDVDGCTLNNRKAYLVNAVGTQYVTEGCVDVDSRMVYISTDFVFDGKKTTPYSEVDVPCPLSVYGQTKLLGEYYISHFLKRFLILRTSRIFGEKGKNFASSLPSLMKKEKKLVLTSNLVNSPTYVADLVNAVMFLIKKGGAGIVNVCNKGECSWYEYALKIKEFLKIIDVELIPVEFEDFQNRKAERPRYSVLDTSLLESLGISMPHWEGALQKFLG
ncbi:MAG: dTDP-4-dehydrorhamnose reductase [Candidatus Ratteibacteria bacterium]|nr:dTDP-4-dehydrorhamnose reductase [Candidatus Ratteibacteria bacterium]